MAAEEGSKTFFYSLQRNEQLYLESRQEIVCLANTQLLQQKDTEDLQTSFNSHTAQLKELVKINIHLSKKVKNLAEVLKELTKAELARDPKPSETSRNLTTLVKALEL